MTRWAAYADVMTRPVRPVLAALVVAIAILGASCSGSGGGSNTPASGVTRPAERPTSEDGTTRPATEAPTTTAEGPRETTAAATTTAADGGGEGDGTTWWPWLVVGLAVLAIVGIVVFLRARRSPDWSVRAAVALDDSDELSTHLVGLAPRGLSAVAGADAARLATLMASVQQLVASAPDDAARQALGDVQERLRSLHGVLDAVSLEVQPPSAAELDEVRSRATQLHSATSRARATVVAPASSRPRG